MRSHFVQDDKGFTATQKSVRTRVLPAISALNFLPLLSNLAPMLKRTFLLLAALSLPAFSQTAKPIDLLKTSLERTAHSVSADWGIYIKSLDTGEEIAINADQVMDTMSVIKIPLMVDSYRLVDAGKLNTTAHRSLHGR